MRSEVFARLPDGGKGSGARFGSDGRLYVTDYRKHRILIFEPGQRTPRVYVEGAFLQPNDLAIAADGTLYASDPDFKHTRTLAAGSVWRVMRQPDGQAIAQRMVVEGERLWRPNGIDLSPDGRALYVSEADLRQVLAFRIDGDALRDRKVLRTFAAGELDGLRTDARGRIYVARLTQGKIAVVGPDGALIREVPTTGSEPTNLSFGGTDGRTVYVTQKRGGYIESFQADVPGREICIGRSDPSCAAQ
jgi:sugar lactone lactonase YvrE